MNKRKFNIIREHCTWVLLFLFLATSLQSQNDNQISSDTISSFQEAQLSQTYDNRSVFALFLSYGSFGINRKSSSIVSPLIKNSKPSYGIGLITPLVNTKHYNFDFYLGYEIVNIEETFRRSDLSEFSSQLSFSSIYMALMPINITLGKNLGGYISGGGFAKYHVHKKLESQDLDELLVEADEIFNDFEYGVSYKLGFFYRNIKIEATGWNSLSDLIKDRESSPKRNGITFSTIYSSKDSSTVLDNSPPTRWTITGILISSKVGSSRTSIVIEFELLVPNFAMKL